MERFKKLLGEYREVCEAAGSQREGGFRYRGTVDRASQIEAKLCRMFIEDWDQSMPTRDIKTAGEASKPETIDEAPERRVPR